MDFKCPEKLGLEQNGEGSLQKIYLFSAVRKGYNSRKDVCS